MLGQLAGVHPFMDFQLPGLFEEGCPSSDELLLVHVFYSTVQCPHCQPGEKKAQTNLT